jgi:hypothetical protein
MKMSRKTSMRSDPFVPREPLVLHFPNDQSKPQYRLGQAAAYSISQFMQEQLSANMTSGTGMAAALAERPQKNASVSFNGVAFNRQFIPPVLRYIWNRDKLDINSTFGTLATSMTNVIRGTDWGLGTPDEGRVYGMKGTPTRWHNAKWGWIVLHGMILVGGMIVLRATVMRSDRSLPMVPAWKNSSLVAIRQGSSVTEVWKGTSSVHEMEKKAQGAQVTMPLPEQTDDEHGGGASLKQPVNAEEDSGRGSNKDA